MRERKSSSVVIEDFWYLNLFSILEPFSISQARAGGIQKYDVALQEYNLTKIKEGENMGAGHL